MHLDGARLLNALVEQEIAPEVYCSDFNTVSFCLSKGMGCPIGSVLLGSEKDIWYARNMRKMLGGGLRQSGMTAVCALVALEDWEEKLKEDNANARWIAKELNDLQGVSCDVEGVHTNMFNFMLDPKIAKKLDHASLCGVLREKHDILTFPSFQNDAIRIVTHRDVDAKDMEITRDAIKSVLKDYV